MSLTVARGLFGIVVLIFIAWLLSSDRRHFPWKVVLVGLGLQWLLALLVLKTGPGHVVFDAFGSLVTVVLAGADQGAKFVFGPLAGNDPAVAWQAIAGIKIMASIIVVAAISALAYHYGILQRVVSAVAWVMRQAMGVSGAESLPCGAGGFLGQTEAPLLVRPYISRMTRSEVMAMMTTGFAHIAAGVMAVYVFMMGGEDPARRVLIARHLLTASLMAGPGALVMAKILVPERDTPLTSGKTPVVLERETSSLLDALTRGASQGMTLSINVIAMLVAFIALIAILDTALAAFGHVSFVAPALARIGIERLDLNSILGLLFSPVAWILGVDGSDSRMFGSVLGKAMATNEFLAYGSLSEIARNGGMSERSTIMAVYCICNFANFSSIGIQIGGIGAIAPDRRADLVSLGPRAMLAGAMASWMTGCIAGVLL
ncbi:MAG TPA: nucleoside transporter C-terminal domain-containing protein [Phycisphaerae bacterium]|nr:nucleoside transporter C-terminal domain-containing protein [Phycisphaerae bacterium]